MIEVSLSNIEKNFGFKKVLNGFNLELKTKERIALIGPNGSGKTTIFKIIIGEENINNGNISIRKDSTIGMLSQIPPIFKEETTVKEILLIGKTKVIEIEQKLRELENKMSTCKPNELNNLLKRYGILQEKFNNLNGYQLESDINKVCNGFKIKPSMLDRKFNTLSGGEKVRLKLLELIQKKANFLILDEPTNHIDIDTKEMLEEALNEYSGTILFISHDRYFINKLAKRTLCIEDGHINSYLGNYDDYKEQLLRLSTPQEEPEPKKVRRK